MKVYKPIGSKGRFLEMFQGVNKIKLNEGFSEKGMETKDMVGAAFDELLAGNLKVEQVNNQVNGDESVLEVTGIGNGEQATFKFKVTSAPTDQDNVTSITDAKLIQFNHKSPGFEEEYPEGFNQIENFNATRKEDILNFVTEYVDTPSPDDTVADELFQEAIRLIDKVPYKKGTEDIQTNKAYADEKPTNPDVRVQSPELDKYLSELQEYQPEEGGEELDPLAMPPEPTPADMAAVDAMTKASDDDGTIGVDPYDQEPEFDAEEASPEEQQLYSQAYDNLTAAGVDMPTPDQLDKEVLKLKGLDKPVEKTRTIPKGAEDFWEGDSAVGDVNADDVVKQGYENLVPNDKKQQIIFKAAEIIDAELGDLKAKMPKPMYLDAVRKQALEIYRTQTADMNEDDDKKIGGDFPNQMGKKFKPKNQMPKKKKKPQAVVKLSEEEKSQPEDGTVKMVPSGEYGSKVIGDDPEAGNQVPGGKADEKDPVDFDAQQIMIGIGVEMEHTSNPEVALEIAMDHLMEIPDYYTRLNKMEKEAGVEEVDEMKNGEHDEELTDELLGFKPHNVGDYANDDIDSPIPASPEQEKNYWDAEYYKQDQGTGEEEIIDEEEGFEEYQGEIGDRYQDGEGNQFTVRDKVKGGVTLQGQGGESEIATSDIKYLKKL